MNRAEAKSQRLLQIEQLLWAHPEGLTRAEIARRLNVNRSTITKYLDSGHLPPGIYEDDHDGHKLKFDRSADLTKASFSLHEVMALHLATRLLATRTDKHNPHAASALRKLAIALGRLDHNISQHLIRSADMMTEESVIRDPVYLDALEKLTIAWSAGRKVKVAHRMDDGRIYRYTFSPYFIEPYAVGQTAHVIGLREPPGEVRTFKIERLRAVTIEHERYEIPADFDPTALLNHAWGIWYTEAEPVEVVLRFHPRVASRVQESRWQRSQRCEQEADGYLLWRAMIAEPKEMLPWIRGWGADVEVLAPEELRSDVVSHVRELVLSYGVDTLRSKTESSRLLWAKADRKTHTIHRLVYHLIDVGLVAQQLWDRALHPILKRNLADWLQISEVEAGRFVAFLASLHDLGKASPAFQDHPWLPDDIKRRILAELRSTGLSFPSNRPRDEKRSRHEVLSTWSLRSVDGEQLLSTIGDLPAELSGLLAQVLGGHHGAWPRPDLFGPSHLTPVDKGGKEWSEMRADLVRTMKQIFEPPHVTESPFDPQRDNVPLTLLSAVVAAADWIGSQEDRFPLEEQILPLEAYIRHARLHAQCALDHIQWASPAFMTDFKFERVFPFPPNTIQTEIIDALGEVALPALAIIEAPMGLGKTEAALAVYATWAKQMRQAGIYIAMPTTATSNQMHDRTAKFLTKQLGQEIEPLLVHSQALLRRLPASTDGVEEKAHDGDTAAAQSWFLPRRKSLLAAYGVGTVDQALMGILQTKHFFVRLLGLSYKVVVFDEVHAYDVYMSELFERLLAWLRAVGASVIILSATLPEKTRQRLVRAYGGDSRTRVPEATYPRLTVASADGRINALPLTPPPAKTLNFDWLSRAEEAIIARLRESLASGGCAAVICNTVTRAQDLFQAIRDMPEALCDDDDLILFHARFPLAWREEIEAKVLRRFGPGDEKGKPNPNRPRKAIVVATQVIEQSLDLDFDVMISDHAPVDLLLQRSGRLQRHSANDPRPHPNCLWITEPAVEEGVPCFERGDTYVYDEYVLLRSWLALKNSSSKTIEIPGSVDDLIGAVYGDVDADASQAMKAALATARKQMENDQFGERAKARKRRTPKPDDEELLWGDNLELEEDNPTVHETFQAMTRSDRPGLSVVCLHRIGEKLYLDPIDENSAYDPGELPNRMLVRDLARHAVSIRRPDIESQLLAEPSDEQAKAILKQWRRIAALRYHRVIIFENGVYRPSGTPSALHLQKDNQLGLQISKETL